MAAPPRKAPPRTKPAATPRRAATRARSNPARSSRTEARGQWIGRAADSPLASWALGLVAWTESFLFVVPPDSLLLPMAIARPPRWLRLAVLTTLASVLGALTGYAIGALAFDAFGEPLLTYYGLDEQFEAFASDIVQHGAWAILIAGITPFPFKVATILSGTTGLNVWLFTACCLLARGGRFALVAWLAKRFGPPAVGMLRKLLGLTAAMLAVTAIGVLLVVALLP